MREGGDGIRRAGVRSAESGCTLQSGLHGRRQIRSHEEAGSSAPDAAESAMLKRLKPATRASGSTGMPGFRASMATQRSAIPTIGSIAAAGPSAVMARRRRNHGPTEGSRR